MSATRSAPAIVRDLGRADYETVFAAMRAFTDARAAGTPDELWIVEHPPVYTLGLGADPAHVLAAYNLAGKRIDGAPGIYMADGAKEGAKIAALGLKVRGNGCTYHGVSLNVAMDLSPFGWINPCGYAGLETVDMRSVGGAAALADVQTDLARALIGQLSTMNTEAAAPAPLEQHQPSPQGHAAI